MPRTPPSIRPIYSKSTAHFATSTPPTTTRCATSGGSPATTTCWPRSGTRRPIFVRWRLRVEAAPTHAHLHGCTASPRSAQPRFAGLHAAARHRVGAPHPTHRAQPARRAGRREVLRPHGDLRGPAPQPRDWREGRHPQEPTCSLPFLHRREHRERAPGTLDDRARRQDPRRVQRAPRLDPLTTNPG
jgi:hypothetical protein